MSARLDRCRLALAERDLAGAAITQRQNVRYLSGFTGSNGALLLPVTGEPVLVTDGRYVDQAARESPGCAVVRARSVVAALAELMTGGRWGVETHDLTADAYAELTRTAHVPLVSLERAVEQLRVVKDADEVAALRAACSLSVAALTDLLERPLAGRTERQVATLLERTMIDMGAEAVGFDTIVAAGENSAIPHHGPTDRPITRGDLLKIDFGARVDGYHADCTRTFVIGPADVFQRQIHAAVQRAQAAGVAALVEADRLAAPWHAAAGPLRDAGWLGHFTTGLGHGVGLAIHEDPYPSEHATGTLAARMVLTVEPGIYVPGRGGVRIEDTVLVTSGQPEILTPWTTELLEIA